MEKSIIYNNRKFTIGTAGRYYFATVHGKTKSLHRYKYEQEKGPIPEGWHIHHKDGNHFNNDIENLEAIEPKAHLKLHPTSPETLKKWQEAGIKVAPVWHSSEEGIKFHNKHYENVKDKLHAKCNRPCSFCGKEVSTPYKNINCYCSNNCKSAYRRKYKPDLITKKCLLCSKEFQAKKYNGADYCSKECKPAPNKYGKKGKSK